MAQDSKLKNRNIVVAEGGGKMFELFYQQEKLDTIFTGKKVFRNVKDEFLMHIHSPFEEYLPGDSSINKTTLNLTVEVYYENGSKVKAIAYYESGKMYKETEFNEFGRNGADRSWYRNGFYHSIAYYRDGKQASPATTWYDDGSLLAVEDYYFKKLGCVRTWYKNGAVCEVSCKVTIDSTQYDTRDDQVERMIYFDNGNVIRKVNTGMGIQEIVMGYYNGEIKEKGMIKDLTIMRVGNWKGWYENGQLQYEGEYHDSIPNYPMGTWKYWDKQGNLIKEEIYEEGKLAETKEYLPKMEKR